MTTNPAHRARDGFTMIPDWLVESSDVPLHDYAVLIVLMKHARSTGQCHPGFATIAAQARVSRDTVMRSIKSLEALGLIETQRRRVGTKNLPNLYTLHVERDRVVAHSDRSESDSPPEVAAPSDHVVADSDQVGAHSDQRWSLPAILTRLTNETYEPDRVHRDAKHDEADDVFDINDTESGDASSAESLRPITDKQFSLLKDWHILAGFGLPTDDVARWMRDLTGEQFQPVKRDWMRERDSRGRGADYDGPVSGDPEYEHLSARGKQWADAECLPGEMST